MSTDEQVLKILGKSRTDLKTDLNGGFCGRPFESAEDREAARDRHFEDMADEERLED